MVDITNNAGAFSTRYWQKSQASHRESINNAALNASCQLTPHACKKWCYIACGRMAVVQKERHAGLKLEGPEYKTIYILRRPVRGGQHPGDHPPQMNLRA